MNEVGAPAGSANRKSGLRAARRLCDAAGVIHRLEFRRYRLAFRLPLRTAHGPWGEREGVLVRLTSAAGVAGYGEAAPIPWFGTETVDEVEAACRDLGEHVPDDRLDAVPAELGCLRNALAAARAPVAPPPADPSPLGVAALLPAGRAAPGVAATKGEAGFRVFKWKVGVATVADELGLLDDVCAALPPGAKLRLDANGAWDRRQAERWLERCAERPIEFLEQPIAPDAPGASDLLLGLAADYPTPLALDESLVGEKDLERWLGAGWPGVYVVKPALWGDVAAGLQRLAQARAAVVFSSALETAVGDQAALRAAWAWTGPRRALGFGVWPMFVDSRCDGPHAGPFLRREDIERINPEDVWNALS